MATETEGTQRLDRVIEEGFNNGQSEVIEEVIGSDYVLEGPGASAMPREVRGPRGSKR
jgi:hypothetical protein